MEYVILGTGIAGTCAAETIRQLDASANITMIGDESSVPYSRPMISMVLAGSVAIEKLAIRSPHFYDELRIKPILGRRVASLDLQAHHVRIQGGQTVAYDKLLIATGADARPIKSKGAGLENIFYMRNRADIQKMLGALSGVKKALVLGGGLVGFKAAYGLMKRGLCVTMLIASDYPLSMQLDETAGKMILDELVRRGLEVQVGVSVEEFCGNGRVSGVFLSDGRQVDCDMAVVGKGVLPSLSFVPRNEIKVDLGVMVDAHLQTSAEDVFAAGDAAESIDIIRKTCWVNAIWPEAVDQGRIAGMNMAARPVTYRGSLSRNVMRVFRQDVLTLGLVNPPEGDSRYTVLSRLDQRRRYYRRLVMRRDVLVGVSMVNAIEQGGILLALVRNEVPLRVSPEKLLDLSFNFGQLLF